MEGRKIYTTAEIVILSSKEFVFKRAKDRTTPWEELHVHPLKIKNKLLPLLLLNLKSSCGEMMQ